MDSLVFAAETGDILTLRALLQQGKYNVNDDDIQGKTLLHYACENRHLNVIRALVLEFDAVVNFVDDAGCTPLHYACKKGYIDVVELLVHELKADMTIQDNIGQTMFHYACENGHVEVVRALLSEFESDSVSRDKDGLSPLHYACRKGHLDIVRAWLAKFESDIIAEDNNGCTPYFYACESGHLDVLRALISEYQVRFSTTDIAGRTLLHYASRNGHIDVVRALLFEFNEEPTKQDSQGQIPLHYACDKGCLDIVRVLVTEFKDGLTIQDNNGHTPLHSACRLGHLHVVRALMAEFKVEEGLDDADSCEAVMLSAKGRHEDMVLALLDDYKCPVVFKDQKGWGILHYACAGGSVSLVQTLIHKYVRWRDYNKYTVLKVALDFCQFDVVFCLICGFGFDPNVADQQGRQTPLHYACQRGDIDLVRELVQKHEANTDVYNIDKMTPLDVAIDHDRIDIALCLICEFNCNPNVSNKLGQTPLHFVCKRGDVDLVRTLIHKHGADFKASNNLDKTPLDVAVSNGQFDTAFCLICEFGCDPNVADEQGHTPLHHACKMGNIDLVRTLVYDHKANLYSYDNLLETPLQAAYKAGNDEIVEVLISEYDCNLKIDLEGQTLLHDACKSGSLNLVHSLCKHQADVNVLNKKMDTPLHIAAREGRNEIVLALVKEYGCDPSTKGYLERTALHMASDQGHAAVVQSLLSFTSPVVTDKFGNTPLHFAAGKNNYHCTQVLINSKAPVLIRNNNGATPIDAARGESQAFLLEHIKDKSRLVDYKEFLEQAKKEYSGSHYIIRIFVLGYPGAGKSSLVESLKREGFFQSFNKVSESSVPRHTAGIIPSVHMSKKYGRVQFYDFAGDAEYYSSHAAIFESIAFSRKGDNIFIVVVDMRKDDVTVKTTLHYWFSFIRYQRFKKSSFIVVGSHVDKAADCESGEKILDQFCTAMQPNVRNIKHFLLDCRNPRSNSIAQFKKQILKWVSNKSQKCEISSEARLLLGLLRKDFSAVTACPVQTLVSHIKDSGVCIPLGVKGLHRILLELHELGVLLVLGDCTKEGDHIVLKVSKLTNEVHELLFSKSALSRVNKLKAARLNIGILPEEMLEEILPPYITNNCLIHLQYCQQISHKDISVFLSMEQEDSTSQSFLFFPALCSVDKSQVSWDESSSNRFSIGWLALCTDPHDYFPPRFLHVLLLRLVYGFTLSSARQKTAHASPEHSRRCTMWKNGVHWLMEEGVDCMVELVNGSKGVVVLTKSCADGAEDCTRIFTKVVSCVMEAKAEFCYSNKPDFFLLDSSAEDDCLNEDHQFTVSDVERALESPEGKRVIISVSGRGKVELSIFLSLKQFTLWNTFFPFDIEKVLHTLRVIIHEISDLGLVLGVPQEIRESLKVDFPSDVTKRRTELVNWWMKNSPKPPCWYILVEALEDIERSTLAGEIRDEHGLHLQLQEKLLGEQFEILKPDEEFLHSLSGVVGSRWPSLAASLALSEEEIEELKEEVELTQQELALQMLLIWVSREDATYGHLYQILKKVLLFQYCIYQHDC